MFYCFMVIDFRCGSCTGRPAVQLNFVSETRKQLWQERVQYDLSIATEQRSRCDDLQSSEGLMLVMTH